MSIVHICLAAALVLLAPAAAGAEGSVPTRLVLAKLSEALAGLTGEIGLRIELANAPALELAPGAKATVRVEDVDYDMRAQRFAATLVAPAGDPAAPRVRVHGRWTRLVEVPVLRSRVAAGTVIASDDVELMEIGAEGLRHNIVASAADLVGQAAKRSLAAGVPVRVNEIQRPVLVAKGALVTMTMTLPNMALTATGRAVEPGASGDVIQVMNLQSRKTVAATVIGANLVAVAGSRVLSAAN